MKKETLIFCIVSDFFFPCPITVEMNILETSSTHILEAIKNVFQGKASCQEQYQHSARSKKIQQITPEDYCANPD